jgi:hypothetical protein
MITTVRGRLFARRQPHFFFFFPIATSIHPLSIHRTRPRFSLHLAHAPQIPSSSPTPSPSAPTMIIRPRNGLFYVSYERPCVGRCGRERAPLTVYTQAPTRIFAPSLRLYIFSYPSLFLTYGWCSDGLVSSRSCNNVLDYCASTYRRTPSESGRKTQANLTSEGVRPRIKSWLRHASQL